MNPTYPSAPSALQLGVGMDLAWGSTLHSDSRGEDVASDALVTFLTQHVADFGHLFISWQPKYRGKRAFDPREYFAAYDNLFARIGEDYRVRGLHHTALNLGALESYPRGAILELTGALIERYDFKWVNEDVGLWSIHGKPLPYPLAPYLTAKGLGAAVRNVQEVQRALKVPLVIEFPGFSSGTALVVGTMHGYDFFRKLAEESNVPVTLDTGHLLSYQWLRGRRGDSLFDELELLPLDRCFEVHLSGCAIEGEEFHDRHHGILLAEQIELLSRLKRLCPNVRAITYEDPVFEPSGAMAPETRASFDALRSITRGFLA